jgi:2,5-diamino-6-(ribosylamino)-4(3H)-pyrimidinone 5'-phosphate reductase
VKPSPKPRSFEFPFVLLNMAMTADGKIATANRRVSSFSSERDQVHLLELRATADAVMAGARTVESGAGDLGPGPAKYRRLRLRRGLKEYNLRVIVSASGSVNPSAEVFRRRFSPIIILTTQRITQARWQRLQMLAHEVKVCGQDEIDFTLALRWLARKWRVRRLLCEGGGELNSALLVRDLVDEINLTVCPRLIGGRKAPTIADGVGALHLRDAREFQWRSMKRTGQELFLVLRRASHPPRIR